MTDRLLYDVPGAAEQLSLSPATVRKLLREGRLEKVKLGPKQNDRVRVPHSSLVAFIDAQRRANG